MRVGAGKDELSTTLWVVADFQKEAADTIAGAEFVAVAAFFVREYSLGGAEFDDHVTALGATHDAGDDIADLVLIFLEYLVFLDLAEALVQELLRGLSGDATEVGHVDRLANLFADFGVGAESYGRNRVHLLKGVRDGVGHLIDDVGLELPGDGVGGDVDVLSRHDRFLDGGFDGLNDEGAGFILWDVLLFFEVLEELFDVDAHGVCGVGGEMI